MFGTRTAALDLKITKCELELESLKKSFRSLESEWTDTLHRFDSMIKRLNRAKATSDNNHSNEWSGDAPAAGSQRIELTPEMIEQMWERQQHG